MLSTETECTVGADQFKLSHGQMCTQLALLIIDQCMFEVWLFTVCVMKTNCQYPDCVQIALSCVLDA